MLRTRAPEVPHASGHGVGAGDRRGTGLGAGHP
jgi:hypothetical protein